MSDINNILSCYIVESKVETSLNEEENPDKMEEINLLQSNITNHDHPINNTTAKKVDFMNSSYLKNKSDDINGENQIIEDNNDYDDYDDYNDFIVANTQAISQIIDDVAQLSDGKEEKEEGEDDEEEKDMHPSKSKKNQENEVALNGSIHNHSENIPSQSDFIVATTQDILDIEDDHGDDSIEQTQMDNSIDINLNSYTQTSETLITYSKSPDMIPTQVLLPENQSDTSSYDCTPSDSTNIERNIQLSSSLYIHKHSTSSTSTQPTTFLSNGESITSLYHGIESNGSNNERKQLKDTQQEQIALAQLEQELLHQKKEAERLEYKIAALKKKNSTTLSSSSSSSSSSNSNALYIMNELSDQSLKSHPVIAKTISPIQKPSSPTHLESSTILVTSPIRKFVTHIGSPVKISHPVVTELLPERKLLKRRYGSNTLSPVFKSSRINGNGNENENHHIIDPSSPMTIGSVDHDDNGHGHYDDDFKSSKSTNKLNHPFLSSLSSSLSSSSLSSSSSNANHSNSLSIHDNQLKDQLSKENKLPGNQDEKKNEGDDNNSNDSNSDLDEYDIPKVWTLKYIQSVTFSLLWTELKGYGWVWKNGKGIVSFVYIRPGKIYAPPYISGQDYFISENDILEYIKVAVQSHRKLTNNFSNGSRSNDDSSSNIKESKLSSSTKRRSHDKSYERFNNNNSNSSIDHNWRHHNIDEIEWNDLWSYLKEEGWTYTYGSGIIDAWYIRPGYKAKTAIAKIEKFSSQEAVRKFLKSQLPVKIGNPSTNKIVTISTKNKSFKKQQENRQQSMKTNSQSIIYDSSDDGKSCNNSNNDHLRFTSNGGFSYSTSNNYESPTVSIKRTYSNSSSNTKSYSSEYHDKNNNGSNNYSRDITEYENMEYENMSPTPTNSRTNISRPPSPDRRKTCLPPHIRGDTMNSSTSSKSSIHERNRNTDDNGDILYLEKDFNKITSRIFEGLNIIVSGYTHKDKLENLIKEHKGTLCFEFPLPSYFIRKTNRNIQTYIVIGHPTGFRRPKNLLALTYGIPVVHELWLHRSIELKRREPLAGYMLPSGTSSLYTCSAFPPDNRQSNITLFQNIKFLNLADISWKIVIESAGGSIVERTIDLLNDIECFRRIDNRVDYILVDSFGYREAIIKDSQNNNDSNPNSMTRKGYSSSSSSSHSSSSSSSSFNEALTNEAFLAVRSCLRRNSALGKPVGGINIVSVEWLVNCIILSKIVSPMEKDVFQMPVEPKTKPTVLKIGPSNERYVLDDIIRYYADNDSNNSNNSFKSKNSNSNSNTSKSKDRGKVKYGRIVSFYQSNLSSPMQVKILPLEVVEVDFSDIDDSNISEDILNKYQILYGTSNNTWNQSKKHRKEDNKEKSPQNQLKALTISYESMSTHEDCITILANRITSKVILLERKSYRALEYAWSDPNIFCVSTEWEEQDNESDFFIPISFLSTPTISISRLLRLCFL